MRWAGEVVVYANFVSANFRCRNVPSMHGEFDRIDAKTRAFVAYIRLMALRFRCSSPMPPMPTMLAVASLSWSAVEHHASAELFGTVSAEETSTESADSHAANQAQSGDSAKSGKVNVAKDRTEKSRAGSNELAAALAASELVRSYRNEKIDALIAKPLGASPERQAERLREITLAAARELVSRGLSDTATAQDRTAAIDAIQRLHSQTELTAALKVLQGEAGRANLVASDSEVRGALMKALANDAKTGHVALVQFAVEESDPVRASALAAMPDQLSENAEASLAAYLAGDRELFVNRAASIASAHAGAALIPPLIAAQSTPPRQKRGDEAWIAIGKSISYVADVVPVVGDASGAFQPVPGTVFEGSVLRIMESVVTIYRTEVYFSLRRVVERATGQPAPPFGWDAFAWNQWYENEFPALAAKHAEREARGSMTESAVTAPPSIER